MLFLNVNSILSQIVSYRADQVIDSFKFGNWLKYLINLLRYR